MLEELKDAHDVAQTVGVAPWLRKLMVTGAIIVSLVTGALGLVPAGVNAWKSIVGLNENKVTPASPVPQPAPSSVAPSTETQAPRADVKPNITVAATPTSTPSTQGGAPVAVPANLAKQAVLVAARETLSACGRQMVVTESSVGDQVLLTRSGVAPSQGGIVGIEVGSEQKLTENCSIRLSRVRNGQWPVFEFEIRDRAN